MKLDQAFGIYEHTLQLRAQRSEVLAANLANADTPGYKARDIDFAQVLQGQMSPKAPLTVTHSRHISTASNGLPEHALAYRVPLQPSVDGNTVDPDQEQMAFSRNAMEYQASLEFLSGRVKGLRSAIRGD
jgi:flagellar basal-body rod protein FlgB